MFGVAVSLGMVVLAVLILPTLFSSIVRLSEYFKEEDTNDDS